MSLTKLFNLKYFLQNVKKSKALILLLLIAVPMFTSIMLLTVDSAYVMTFAELSIINIIGMYIIPIVLSMTLFDYVYKKNSVDFIGSMPLSRRTIFLTNTIGGIGIIIITQLLTMLSTLFLSQILSEVVIFGSMVWDIFIFFTVSYIFVFTVSNLAISFSGNKFSQLVSILIILFLVPFIMISCELLGDDYRYISVEERVEYSLGDEGTRIIIEDPQYFTAPSYIFGEITNARYEYSTESIVKMLVLSVIYTAIGLFLFERKKLEMAGESYESEMLHLVVKLITFMPFMFIYCMLNNSDKVTVFLFFVAILAVYYFLFDLITNKKIKMKVTIPAFIISWIVVFAIYEGVLPKFGNNNIDIINVNDVKNIYIESVKYNSNYRCDFGLLVEDEELMKLILTHADKRFVESSSYEYVDLTIDEAIVDEGTEKVDGRLLYRGMSANLIIELENGKTYECSKHFNGEIYQKILAKYGKEKVSKDFAKYIPLGDRNRFTESDEKEILETINNEFNTLTFEELYKIYNGTFSEYDLALYRYKNHRLIKNDFSYKGFEELHKLMTKKSNMHTKQVLYNIDNFYMYNSDDIMELIESKNPELFVDDNPDDYDEKDKFRYEFLYDIGYFASDEIKEFIKNDNHTEFDHDKEYIVIKSNYPSYYFTNDLDGFYNLIAKVCNKQYNNYNIKLNENI
ncbi:MAG: hypothetical protein IKK43_02430 [Clostridia bacterium]|nr:hypothetical protein [Clostridia bacterium]